MATNLKQCAKCKEEKGADAFYNDSSKKDGKTAYCKECTKSKSANQYWSDPQKHSQYHKERYKRIRPEDRRTFAEFVADLKATAIGRKAASLKYAHKRRLQLLERNYGMSELDEFAFEEAINLCKLREQATGFSWHVDHTVPLNHRQASGLHVAANFQVVPAWWNFQKKNTNMDEFNISLLSAQ